MTFRRIAADLVASDERYFELGARIDPVAGVRLAWMVGLADMLAACVVLDGEVWSDRAEAMTALDAVEERVREVGGSRVRLYLEREVSAVVEVLRDRGYSSREEAGYVLPQRIPGSEKVSIQPISTDADWAQKQTLHRESPDPPDGHEIPADRWVELERRKTGSDGLSPWLILVGDTVTGTAAVMDHGALMRLKNLLVHREYRRRGIATAAIAAFGIMAEEKGRTLGLFTVVGSAGDLVYRGCGMKPVARWVEWLGPPARRRPSPTGRP